MALTLLEQFPLRPGRHLSRDDGLCAMEMVAWLAGEEHSDEPDCACPVLTAYTRCFNDLLPDDAARIKHLRPLIPRLVNSRRNARVARARAFMAADCSSRFLAALHLARLGRIREAEGLRKLAEVNDEVSARVASEELKRIGPELRAVIWTLDQAAAGRPVEMWVTGAVHAAKATNSWHCAQRLLRDMAKLGQTRVKKG